MSFSVNFNRHQDFEVNEKYVNQLLTNDKDTKVVVDLMDKIGDFFRGIRGKEKKQMCSMSYITLFMVVRKGIR